MRLGGRTAAVTGGARGIGAAIARCLAEEGARVAILDLDLETARATASGLGNGSIGLLADAADASAMSDAIRQAADELGGEEAIIIRKEQLAKFARAQQLKASGQTIPKELLKKRSKLQRQFKYIYI